MPPRLLALAGSLLLAGCASLPARAPVQVTAVLVEFQEAAHWSHFADGSHQVDHASRLRIVAPAELCGARLEILHGELPDPASPWRRVGGRVQLTVSPEEVAGLRAEAAALRAGGTSSHTTGARAERESGASLDDCIAAGADR